MAATATRRLCWIISLLLLERIRWSYASVNGIYASGRRRHSTIQQQQSAFGTIASSRRRRRVLLNDRRTRLDRGEEKCLLASTAAPPAVSTADLGIVGKTVSGIVELSLTVVMEYISGFMGGYFLGTLFGVPGFLARPLSSEARLPFLKEIGGRAARMHSRSFRWAYDWGFLSSVFSGSKTFVKVVRNGKQDEWNTIFSSMMGGAILRRKDGPAGMLKGALFYGLLIYVFSFNSGKKKEIFTYKDETLEF